MRILVVEDDELIGEALKTGLAQRGFSCDWAPDGVAGEAALETEPYAAVVLDLGLPRLSGLTLLSRLRARGRRVPVLVLTARGGVDARIEGLDTGADDYLAKPFDLGEVAARLRALIRRAGGEPAPRLSIGGIELDPATRSVRYKDEPVELSRREFALLHALMLNAGRVLSREQLERALYGWDEEPDSNAVEVHIHHLRRKLAPGCILNVRGVGYTLPRPDGA